MHMLGSSPSARTSKTKHLEEGASHRRCRTCSAGPLELAFPPDSEYIPGDGCCTAFMTSLNSDQLNAVLAALRSVGSDLSLPLLITLVAIARDPGLSINELADRIQVPQQTASRYVAILQGRYQMAGGAGNAFAGEPLLSLQVSANDPRRRALYLTPEGSARVADILSKLYTTEVK
jgi:DNA-binding MarR family transcriptional regulator